jgi:uncharacterized protein (DUF1015 family)
LPLARPFRALRPAPARAAEVAAPPYDVLSSDEARVRAAGKPWSFLHVSKPEIDLPPGTDPYSPAVYAKGAENLARMSDAGVLARDAAASYYVYRFGAGDLVQTGVAVTASMAAYDANRVRKHELTRPDKEDDRVRHSIWPVREPPAIERIGALFEAMPAIYIADGHHRSAAASRVAANRRNGADASHEWFLVVAFPHHELRILDYNRVVRDLGGMTLAELLAKLGAKFEVASSDAQVRPARHGEFGLYAGGRWHRLVLRPELAAPADPVARLDVSLLTNHVLSPLLGIGDLRTDKRVDFVGGGRGLGELEKRVDSGEMAAAFSLYPTRLDDLMAVADAGAVMPPTSTWFEPKLADGLLSHVLD